MIRLGIVGSNYGRNVLLPAFLADTRARVVGIAGSDPAKSADLAKQAGLRAFGHWSELIDSGEVDAVAVAVPPRIQPDIAIAALKKGKAVFLEKPLAADLETARQLVRTAELSKRPAIIDFEFPELETWRRAKALLQEQAVGPLRHVMVTWNVENYATRMRIKSWKTNPATGGGVLGNLVSHCFHYLEDFCGPITKPFGAAVRSAERDDTERKHGRACRHVCRRGRRHLGHEQRRLSRRWPQRSNSTAKTARSCSSIRPPTICAALNSFSHGGRPRRLQCIATEPADTQPDGRIGPVSRLAARFLDAIDTGKPAKPDIRDGYRVQQLIDAARRSHKSGEPIDVKPARKAEAFA